VATAPATRSGYVGLHWNSLASMSWGDLGVMMLEASEAADIYGDESPRRIFKQKRLAMPWAEEGGAMVADVKASDYKLADPWEDEARLNNDGKFTKDAKGIKFRTMGVDVQRGHFWAVIRSWGEKGQSRLRWFGQGRDLAGAGRPDRHLADPQGAGASGLGRPDAGGVR